MLKYLYSKKGFTMVELIVVIAIIGILSALIIPGMIGMGKPQEADAKAEGFYRAIQNVFIEYKANNGLITFDTPAMDTGYYKIPEITDDGDPNNDIYAQDGEYIIVYAYAALKDGFTDVKAALISGALPEAKYDLALSAASDPELVASLNAKMSGDDYGHYLALLDNQCRVLECYWCQTDFKTVFDEYNAKYSASTVSFTSTSYIGPYCVGAYPQMFSLRDTKMFLVN